MPGARELAEAGDALFGNIDTFLVWQLTGGPNGGLHVTDVTNASRTQLMNLDTLDWDADLLDGLRDPPRDAAVHPVEQRTVWDGARRADRGRADRRHPRRSAGGARRANLLQAWRGQEHVRHRLLPAAEHRRVGRALVVGSADHGGVSDGQRARALRARGQHRRDRRARAVGARQPRVDPAQLGDRGAGADRARQRRRLLRAGLLGTLRAALERRRPRHDRRPDAIRQSRAHRPRGARGHGVSDMGSAAGDGEGFRA